MRLFVVFLVLLMSTGATAAEPWTIGIIAPTTGPVATVGVRQLSAVQWWVQDANAHGGIHGRSINLIHCNDEGSPEKSVTCMRDLIGKGALLILNGSVSGPIFADMPLVANGPVMVTPSPNVLPSPAGYVFQTSPSDVELTKAIAGYAKANGVKQIAMIAATDASGEVGVTNANTVFKAEGINYKLARIDLRASDASIQLAAIATGAQFIYSNYSGGGAVTVVKSYSNLGLGQPLLISYANISDSFIDLIKDDMPKRLLAVGLKASVPALVTDAGVRSHIEYFAKSYEAWKHEPSDHLSLLGLTMADFAAAVLQHVKDPGNAAEVRKYVETHPIPSVGMMHFSSQSHIGYSAADVAALEYKGGHWEKAGPLK